MNLSDLFTEDEVELLQRAYSPRNGWNIISCTDFSKDFFEGVARNKVAQYFLKREINGKRVIELGPGLKSLEEGSNAQKFYGLGAGEYVAVEPMVPTSMLQQQTAHGVGDAKSATIVSTDGLSYLLQQPDGSAIIFSSGLFLPDAIRNSSLPLDLTERYLHALYQQIGRVTFSRGISLHLHTSLSDEGISLFCSLAGFKAEVTTCDGYVTSRTNSNKRREIYKSIGSTMKGRSSILLRKLF